MTRPPTMKLGNSDEFYTPEIAIRCLLPYLPRDWVIWECAWGGGSLANHLSNAGYKVIGSQSINFLEQSELEFDCIVTNPPYTIKTKFIRRCYEIGKPFALLLPLTSLEGKERGKLYMGNGVQLIIPNKRINFITPSGKGSGSWFQVAWFTYKLNLSKDLLFVEL